MIELCFHATGWTAIGTWVLVLGTLIAVFIQKSQNRLINSANYIMQFHNRFESRHFINRRQKLTQKILDKEKEILDEILVFFETLGCLTKHRVLTKEMVWNDFAWEIVRYYQALRRFNGIDYIDWFRKTNKDKTLYSEFEWLYEEIIKFDRKRRDVGLEFVVPNEQEIQKFLEKETKIKIE